MGKRIGLEKIGFKHVRQWVCCLLMLIPVWGYTQEHASPEINRKGSFYFYWGWNWSWYGKSDIAFKGDDYAFSLDKVSAGDRQSGFDFNTYFNPAKATIPQYNFRVGYFLNEHYDVSFGTDHMKYVVRQGQFVPIHGEISLTDNEYMGIYDGEQIAILEDFLQYEHTDGLNYINMELRRFDRLLATPKVEIGFTGGLGLGVLLPKTNVTLLSGERHDAFHLSGYGLHGVLGLNVTFFKFLFAQSEFRGGYLNMPDVRTTRFVQDEASQRFFFSQINVVFGGRFNLGLRKRSKLGPGDHR